MSWLRDKDGRGRAYMWFVRLFRVWAHYILAEEINAFLGEMHALREENIWLQKSRAEADQRWTEANATMARRAQQARGAFIVRRDGRNIPVLAIQTGPSGAWEITI